MNIFKNKNKFIPLLYLLSLGFLVLWVMSFCTFKLLLLPQSPYPWGIITIVYHQIYLEPFLVSLMLIIPFIFIFLWRRGGGSRVFSLYLSVVFGCLYLSLMCGFLVFSYVNELDFTFNQWVLFIKLESIERLHFMYYECASILIVFLVLLKFIFNKIRPINRALGNAHFASGFEIYRNQFFKHEQESIIIGKKFGAPLYSNGFEHVLVFAPSGSGKTRSIAMPNLLNYPHSIVCNDVKLTLFNETSRFRERVLGHRCFCFAPAHESLKTHRYNPLTFISKNPLQRIADIQRIAHIFIPDTSKEQAFWAQTSRKLFKALVLYLLDTPDLSTTLGEINRIIKKANFDAWLKDTLDTTEHLDPEFYRNGYSYINNDERTRANILESFSGHFELFDDPIIDEATSFSDFDFNDLRRKKITIYVGFTDEDMERLSPILTLFWQQLISTMIKSIPNPHDEPYPLLCLIDEFSSLGRIERLRRSLKLLREYRVRCVLMFQYIAQTYEKYSHDEARAFMNIKTKVAFSTEDINDAEFISKMLGTKTERVLSSSVSRQAQGTSGSTSFHYQAIPLLRPEEIMKLPKDIALIIRSGCPPIKAFQYIWYQETPMRYLPEGQSSVPIITPKQNSFAREDIELKRDFDLIEEL